MSRTPIHAGEILKDELEALGVTGTELARQINVPANRISKIMAGKRNVTADTALRLGKWFGMSPAFWLNLQKSYDLKIAEQEIGADIENIPTLDRTKIPA
ncbi:MAG: HigA family addiction module antidote protein [Rhodospirillaceae bacterium]|jgi:antitoxin HigA-1|nr:HigA family addiction module antidote protein [Rhodospirillaceae bacterium]MBT5667196.1 HigA family addiction module antidote protein [Rhodospirillaceae bacterium]MBT5809376.1 HigA family addiction module antidote protein [Rhodospirillaceae bacterium]